MTTRRALIQSLATLPLATVLADTRLARAAASTLQSVSIQTSGGVSVSGAVAKPSASSRAAILLIHEWWGLNDQIKSVAAEFAKQGYLALACDLYGGKSTTDPDEARSIMQAVDAALATDTVVAWTAWLRAQADSRNRVATIGWCFGGGWSLNASLAAPVDATVIYYGRVNKTADELNSLKGPVLGHFATQDQWINKEMVGGFEQAMDAAGKQYHNYWYDAQHGFANPTTSRYDSDDAALAWQRTTQFLGTTVGG